MSGWFVEDKQEIGNLRIQNSLPHEFFIVADQIHLVDSGWLFACGAPGRIEKHIYVTISRFLNAGHVMWREEAGMGCLNL